MTLIAFDATNIEPLSSSGSFEPLPAGDYSVRITAEEAKQNAGGNGAHLRLEFTVTQGAFAGRKIWDRVTLRHTTSAKAEKFGHSVLSAICHAIGILKLADSAQLIGCELSVKVVIEEATDAYSARNRIVAWSKKDAEPSAKVLHPIPNFGAGKPGFEPGTAPFSA